MQAAVPFRPRRLGGGAGRRHGRLAGRCWKHRRTRLRPGYPPNPPLESNINYTAALWPLLRLPGVLQGAGIFTLRKWACQSLRLRVVDVFCVAGSCRWVPLLFGGRGQGTWRTSGRGAVEPKSLWFAVCSAVGSHRNRYGGMMPLSVLQWCCLEGSAFLNHLGAC